MGLHAEAHACPQKERDLPDLGGAEVPTKERLFGTLRPPPRPRLGGLSLVLKGSWVPDRWSPGGFGGKV